MPPQVLNRIFEPLFATKAPGEGTGLGMSVIHRVVKNVGGAIVVSSHEGQGTRVDVYLPASTNDDEHAALNDRGSHSRQRVF